MRIGNKFYIGSSADINRRVAIHRRLLKKRLHPNKQMQTYYDACGLFEFDVVVVCDPSEVTAKEDYLLSIHASHPDCLNVLKKSPPSTHGSRVADDHKNTNGPVVVEFVPTLLGLNPRVFKRVKDVADYFGVKHQSVRNWISGKRRPKESFGISKIYYERTKEVGETIQSSEDVDRDIMYDQDLTEFPPIPEGYRRADRSKDKRVKGVKYWSRTAPGGWEDISCADGKKLGLVDLYIVPIEPPPTADMIKDLTTFLTKKVDEAELEIISEALSGSRGKDQEAIARTGASMISLLLRKNKDYGGSAWKSPVLCPSLAPRAAMLCRMSDKIERIQTLMTKDPEVVGESIDDTFRDLAGYLMLYLAYPGE